jgi:hypothetical protein
VVRKAIILGFEPGHGVHLAFGSVEPDERRRWRLNIIEALTNAIYLG